MKLVFVSGLVLGYGTWLGWQLFGAALAATAAAGIVIALPFYACSLLLMIWMRRGPILLSMMLLFTALGLSWGILGSILIPVPDCDRFHRAGPALGMILGLICALSFITSKDRKISPALVERCGLRKVAWRNVLLASLVMSLFAARAAVPSLKWGNEGSLALAITRGPEGSLSAELYGRGVSDRTVKVALDKRLEPGYVERVCWFGREYRRGFIPYTTTPGGRLGTTTRLVFHNTQVGDEILATLSRASQLDHIDLRETQVSLIGVGRLRAALPCCQILR
jgi:hypothetical protein